MDPLFLATKVRIPPETGPLVPRLRLIEILEREVLRYRLTAVVAPAGYGKTTLLGQWARQASIPVAWLTAGTEDDDTGRFFRSLIRAWAEAQPGIIERPPGVLAGSIAPDPEATIAAIINEAAALPNHLALIVDDFHLIDDPAIHAAVARLVDYLPPTLHLVLAGRAEPSLPLARFRARRELFELRTDRLRFSPADAAMLLTQGAGRKLPSDEATQVNDRLEGWGAGLHLAALALREGGSATPAVLAGRHRYLADYLNQEVVSQLPAHIQRFLLHTSVLDQLCAELCDAVTGDSGSREMLDWLEEQHLFLAPLDDARVWYHLHGILAGYLQSELRGREPEAITGLHLRAAGWHRDHGHTEPAVMHAVAAESPGTVADIFEHDLLTYLMSGLVSTPRRWFEAIPAAWFAAEPRLDLYRAMYLAFSGSFAASVTCIDQAERRLLDRADPDAQRTLSRIVALRCLVACVNNDLTVAEALGSQALANLEGDDVMTRASVHHALGDVYRQNGDWAAARGHYVRVFDYAREPAAAVRAAHIHGALADVEVRRGRLREAGANWSKALIAVEDRENWGRLPLPLTGWIYVRTAELLYERNDLAGAWRHLQTGLERIAIGGDARSSIAGLLAAGHLKLAEGDLTAATEYLDQARPLVEQAPFPEWVSRFERLRLDLWLAQGEVRPAADWVDATLSSDAFATRPEREPAVLAVALALVTLGNDEQRRHAMSLLDGLLGLARADDRLGIEIEVLAVQALAHSRAGDQPRAMIALEQALRLAEPEDYARTFLDLGPGLRSLLRALRRRGIHVAYVSRLLAPEDDHDPQAALAEPLSQRELEVLALLAAGLTNREIGTQLSISAETVKKHTGSIYGKLGVANRTEAAARARSLAILP